MTVLIDSVSKRCLPSNLSQFSFLVATASWKRGYFKIIDYKFSDAYGNKGSAPRNKKCLQLFRLHRDLAQSGWLQTYTTRAELQISFLPPPPHPGSTSLHFPTGLFLLKPGFHLQQTPRPRHKKQSDYVLEQSSFPLIALFWFKIGRCRGRNWLNGNQALLPQQHILITFCLSSNVDLFES